MKKLKSIVSISLSMLIASSALFGCSKSTATSSATGLNASTSGGAVEEITTYWLGPVNKETNLVQDEVNKILGKDINVKVNLVFYNWDSYQDKTKLALSSGSAGDVMFTAAWNNYATFVGQQAFAPLDDLLEQYGQDIKAKIDPAYLTAAKVSGKLYAIPTNKDMASEWGVVVNKNLADKYKMDFSNVKSPKDLEPFLETIKQNEPDVTPFAASQDASISEFAYDWFSSQNAGIGVMGVPRLSPYKVISWFDDAKTKELMDISHEFYTKGYYNKDVLTCKSVEDLKTNQKAFMWPEQLKPGKAGELCATYGYEFYQLPAYPDLKPTVTTAELTNSMLSIPNSSKHKEAAMKFINELFKNTEVQNLLAWGIEGKHYVKSSDGLLDYPEGVTAQTDGYTGIYQWTMGGSQLDDYLWKTEDKDKWTKMKAWNESAERSDLIGWQLDTTSIQNEISAISNVQNKYVRAIWDGVVTWDSTADKAKQALKTAGLDKVIEETQKQIDEFLKNKG